MKLKHLNINTLSELVPYKESESYKFGNVSLFYKPSPENNGFYFCAVNCISFAVGKEKWTDDTDIEIMCSGWAAFDGIRHIYFGHEKTDNEGYFNYPNLNELKNLIDKLIQLQNRYCSDFGGSHIEFIA